jgi:AGCS family alanine or glycine:cation symporter
MLFAFTSIIYNYYLGENSLNFFSDNNEKLFTVFRVMVLALVLWGSLQDLGTVFGFADVTMGLLALVNLTALALLFRVGLQLMRDYDQQIAAGVTTPVFDAAKFRHLEIEPAAWSDAGVGTRAAIQPAE